MRIIKSSKVEKLEWFIVLVIYFYQFLLGEFSPLSNMMLVLLYIQQWTKQSQGLLKYNTVLLIVASSLLGYSIIQGNSVVYAVRFAIILILVMSSYSWKIDYNFYLKCLYVVSLIQVLGLIILEAYMFSTSYEEYAFIRNEIVKANEIGDIFLYNDIYYKLELKGTSLLAFVYMLSYAVDLFPMNHTRLLRSLYLVGLILAGNFAYQLTIIIFHFVWHFISVGSNPKILVRKILTLSLFLLFIGGLLWGFVSDTVKDKEEGGSLPTRYDQAKVLYKDATRTSSIFLFGSGVGHTINEKTSIRDYRDAVYYEVQSLYIANQLGLIGFTILIITNIILAFRVFKERRLIIVYSLYVLYASTNPYIWDTTQIIVIASLICAFCKIKNYIIVKSFVRS